MKNEYFEFEKGPPEPPRCHSGSRRMAAFGLSLAARVNPTAIYQGLGYL
jgi:hypothetical protein